MTLSAVLKALWPVFVSMNALEKLFGPLIKSKWYFKDFLVYIVTSGSFLKAP